MKTQHLICLFLLVGAGCRTDSQSQAKATPGISTIEPVVIVRTPLINAGTLDAKEVVDELETQTDELVKCYATGLASDPNLAGSVLVTFDVLDDGSVDGTRLAGSRIRDTGTERCVVNEAAKLTFPRLPLGETATVTVPFLLIEFDPNGTPPPVAAAPAAAAAAPSPAPT